MKIISPFRDYYDSAIAYGQDPTRVYERVTRTVEMPGHVWPYRSEPLRRLVQAKRASLRGVSSLGILLFCGRAWPVCHPLLTFGSTRPPSGPLLTEGVIKFHEEVLAAGGMEAYEAKRFFGLHRKGADSTADELREIDAVVAGVEAGEDVLIGLRAPCALLFARIGFGANAYEVREIQILANPRLADLGFQRVLDPFTCFQTIETFLGNQLAPPDVAPHRVGSDEVIARQKGFDEGSFRTAAPGTKKENRAANRARKRKG